MQPLIPFDQALDLLTELAPSPSLTPVVCALNAALNSVLAEDILSPLNVPPADNSAMDGYAICQADLNPNGDTAFPISQRIPAGIVGDKLVPKTAARIFTGAFIPDGADCVIMQEKVRLKEDQALITAPVPLGNNIRRAGEDIKIGQTILKAGKKLTAADLGLAASIGLSKISVHQKIKVAVMCTGDELVEPDTPLKAGQIYNSNRYTLINLLTQMGCDVVDLGIIPDNAQQTEAALLDAAEKADLILSSGGVSVGEEDHVKNALESLGKLQLWKLAIKPGKPLAFGHINKTPFLGLPGNPVSTFAVFCLLARPFILKMQGNTTILPTKYPLAIDFERSKAGTRREFIRVKIITNKGKTQLEALSHQGSGVLSSVSGSDGLAVIMENQTYQKGDIVDFMPYSVLTG